MNSRDETIALNTLIHVSKIEEILRRIEETMIDWKNLTCHCERCKKREEPMDTKIKSAKKVMNKKMDALVKADVKRDKVCDAKMMKKKK